CQTSVLPFLSDRQREHVVRHPHLSSFVHSVDGDAFHFSRTQGVGHEDSRIVMIQDDIYLFAIELIDDRLNTSAAQPHAGSYWIDSISSSHNRNLGAAARLTRYRPDFDNPREYLGHLDFKEATNEIFVASR